MRSNLALWQESLQIVDLDQRSPRRSVFRLIIINHCSNGIICNTYHATLVCSIIAIVFEEFTSTFVFLEDEFFHFLLRREFIVKAAAFGGCQTLDCYEICYQLWKGYVHGLLRLQRPSLAFFSWSLVMPFFCEKVWMFHVVIPINVLEIGF